LELLLVRDWQRLVTGVPRIMADREYATVLQPRGEEGDS
jgi:hypothetical protein